MTRHAYVCIIQIYYINVGELKSIDANGKEIWITEDQDKANELAKFYSDIFTIEVDEGPIVSLQTATVCDDIDLREKLIGPQ